MKKIFKLVAFSALVISSTSCATIFGGPVTAYQRTKPAAGEPTRQIRGAALIADIFLGGPIAVIIDFATSAIYKPAPEAAVRK